ncbi:unnamed protein product [Polarella glacialis]|uniref:EF-hand domain-containing protein n=1 Tax=Polarella glacialis TaxID=89957 RepID=A0A813JNW2_POLGL|nr:unnamed protein product [Polarella glacialis]
MCGKADKAHVSQPHHSAPQSAPAQPYVPGAQPYVPGAQPYVPGQQQPYTPGAQPYAPGASYAPGKPSVASSSGGASVPGNPSIVPEYTNPAPSEEQNEQAIRALLGASLLSPAAQRTDVALAGLVASEPEVDAARLRAAHVPAAPIGIRIEVGGQEVPLDSDELRNFRLPPSQVEVWATHDKVDTLIFHYPDGAQQFGLNGDPVGKWGGQKKQPFQLRPQEFITKISGWATSPGKDACLASIRFHTSKGRISCDYGAHAPPSGGQPFEFRAPPGTVVAAFARQEGPYTCPRIIEAICISHPSDSDLVAAGQERLRQLLSLPADWDIPAFCKGKRLEGQHGGRTASCTVAKVSCPEVIPQVQGLFDSTFRKIYTRDRRGAPIADRFRVMKVYRVMNDQVWREYQIHREKIRLLRWTGPPTSKRAADPRAHGLPELDPQAAALKMFGGVLSTSASSRSDEYGEGPKGAAGEEQEGVGAEMKPPPGPPPELYRDSVMLLCRSLLGKVKYTDEQRPDPDRLQRSCLSEAPEFDSVLGDRRKINGTFREFVVYHDDQVYPEFIVVYQREFFHERFQRIFFEMVDRCRRHQFHGPTADEENVLKSLWEHYSMPHKGKIDKWQLLDLLKAIDQPPQNETDDLDATFQEINTSRSGRIDWKEFLTEVIDRVGFNGGKKCICV